METPSYVSLPFVFNQSLETSFYLGAVIGSEWTLYTNRILKCDSTFSDLHDVKLVRTVCTESVHVEVTLSQWNKTGLIWHGRKLMVFTEGQRIGVVLPEDFPQRMENTDVLKGVVKISNTANFDTCGTCAIHSKLIKSNHSNVTKNTFASIEQLSGDLFNLLDADAQLFPDAVLKCASVEIPVHRCILSARSPVMAAIFRKEQAENNNGQLNITIDIKPEVIRKLLMYIYSGKVDDLTYSMAGDLLYAADAFKLEVLKGICVDKLASVLSADNVLDILTLGDRLDERLKEFATNYICQHCDFSELVKMEEWKSLKAKHSGLAMEVLSAVVKHVSIKKMKWYTFVSLDKQELKFGNISFVIVIVFLIVVNIINVFFRLYLQKS